MVKRKKWTWKNVLLNILAVCLTITPIFSVGAWAFTVIKGDSRQLVELAEVKSVTNPRLFEEPLVSVAFDDGWESMYSLGMPILSEHGIVTTQYILPGMFTSPAYISLKQANHIKEIGHEIASHTYTHQNLTKVSQKELVKELSLANDILVKNKLASSNMNFAAPNGEVDNNASYEIKKYYNSQRNVAANLLDGVDDRDVNLKGKFNQYNIIGYTIGSYTTMEDLKKAIEFTREHNGWLVLIYHQVNPELKVKDGEISYEVTPEQLDSQMALVKSSGIKLSTVSEVLNSYKGGK